MSMYTTAQLLAANEQKFKFDPLFLRLFFRESYPFTTEKVYLSQIPGLVNMALYVSPIVSGEVIRSRGGSTSEFTPGYVKPKHEVNPQMTLRRLPDEDPQNLADPAYRRRRIIMQNMRDEELAIAQVEEMQAVSAGLTQQGLTQASYLLAYDSIDWYLNSLSMPIPLCYGEKDSITPPEGMFDLKQKYPNLELIPLAAAGHLAYLDQPALFNQQVFQI